ncbi:ABC transporter substrate-binding protein [Otariodibacter oris]|uniref:Cationic peptide transport system substrate-binding protein n=1 Tax=Otariodibacter oris TaxID=1032623 RepID=A0A420XIR7_9PAST|nr:ABC transporter substrate-binding protein [Otariodibacter oris]QGM80781.1 peptide ABC transporter substrate-binding protein [Otariodibacter oris]RKR77051.1 cationic peptide transport system substrate-binding protein [Otariodibacter oris]
MKLVYQAVSLAVSFATLGYVPNTVLAAPRIPEPLLNSSAIYCTDTWNGSFNPQRAEVGSNVNVVTEHIYDKLIEFDPNENRLIPSLAERFEVSEDGLLITFHLRKDVEFQHTNWFTPTRKMNAEDVVFSLNRMMNKEFELPELSEEQQETLRRYHINHEIAERTYFPYFESVRLEESIKAVSIIDDNTVQIELWQKSPTILEHLSSQHAVILSKEYALQLNADDNLQQLARLPVGTGSYQLENYAQNDFARLKANSYYWREQPEITNMVVDFASSSTGRMAKFLNGECDILAFPEPSQMPILKKQKSRIIENEGANLAFLAFNTERETMKNALLRRKIAESINRKRLLKTLFYDTAKIADSVLPYAISHQINSKSYPYQPEPISKKLRKSDRFSLWVVDEKKVYNSHPVKMAELIRSDLAKVGIRLNIRKVSRAYLVQQIANNTADYDLILDGWLANNFQADDFFRPILSCQSVNSITNLSNWCSPAFDALLDSAKSLPDGDAKNGLYEFAQDLLEKEMPVLPLVSVDRIVVTTDKIDNLSISRFGHVNLAKLKLKYNVGNE